MLRLLFVLIGYIFGLFQTGYFYGKLKGVDLKKEGSGNTGATNALRVMGVSSGLIVFFFDALKAFIPVFVVRLIYKDDPLEYIYALYAGLGVILGNDFPFYLKFNGGKGVAAMAGWGLGLNAPYALICIGVFFLIAFTTKIVSLASLITCAFIIGVFLLFMFKGWIPIVTVPLRIEAVILVLILVALLIIRHKNNIKRLAEGKENKFGRNK